MSELISMIKEEQAIGFTHGGKFHADDVFASALLLHLNSDIVIKRGNKVPEDFEGLVFDIGRGKYDHHQRDSRIRENGVPYAAFGLLWEELGPEILGSELAAKFDEEFVQPLDLNDNTGEKNELASLIGDFNPTWDDESNSDLGFFQAVGFAGMILDNKFARYKSNGNADMLTEQYLAEHMKNEECSVSAERQEDEGGLQQYSDLNQHILVLPQFVPCQKKLPDTMIKFVIFPSNRGGYCIQPVKKAGSSNYKCAFPNEWLGLDGEELQNVSAIATAQFCHKGGFIMTVTELEDAKMACRKSMQLYKGILHYAIVTETKEQAEDAEELIQEYVKQTNQGQINQSQMNQNQTNLGQINQSQTNQSSINQDPTNMNRINQTQMEERPEIIFDEIPYQNIENEAFEFTASVGILDMEKQEWKKLQSDLVGRIRDCKPEAVVVDGSLLNSYPLIHQLRKKGMSVLVPMVQDGKKKLIRIPSGS